MEFMPSENKVYVSTYSPKLDLYETDANSKFVFDYSMTTGIRSGSLTYSLGGTDASRFTINSSTGLVSMVARDFENPNDANLDNVYEVSVIATDFDANVASKSFNVTVANVNEPTSFSINPIADATIGEGLAYIGGTPVITGAPHGNLTYSLGGTDAGRFTINSSTGVVSMIARNFEQPADNNNDNRYEITIICTDNDGNNDDESLVITITSGPADAGLSIFDPATSEIKANGISKQTLTVRTKDAQGDFQTVGGALVTMTQSSGTGTISAVADNNNGTYTATVLSPLKTGEGVFISSVNGQPVKSGTGSANTVVVKYIPDTVSISKSTIKANDDFLIANGQTTTLITVQLKDPNANNLISGSGTVRIFASLGILGTVTDHSNGVYTATLTSGAVAGNAILSAKLNNFLLPESPVVKFLPVPASTTTSTILASKGSISSAANSGAVITVQLKDAANNNIITGENVVTISSIGGSIGVTTNNNDGTYTALLSKGKTAGSASLNFTINGSIADKKATVILENDLPKPGNDDICSKEGVPITFNVLGNDTDSDGIILPATIDLLPLIPGIQKNLSVTGQGAYTANMDGTLTFAPIVGYYGQTTPIYYVVMDNNGGLSLPASISVFVNPAPLVSIAISSGSAVMCAGSSITFNASTEKTGSNTSYQWRINDVNTGNNAAVFQTSELKNGQVVSCVITTNAACGDRLSAVSNQITVAIKPLPLANVTASGPLTFFSYGSVKLTVTEGINYTYQWLKSGDIISGANQSSYTAAVSGSYSVKISSNACVVISNSFDVKVIFGLPSTNFNILAKGETCRTSNNGIITINAVQPLNYVVSITGNNTSASYNFNSSLNIENLSAGSYTLCIAVGGNPEYKQCYSIVITEPKDLALFSSVNTSTNTLSLKLEGGSLYHIELNGKFYSTVQDQITLPLNKGNNKLSVRTDNNCQGIIERRINLAEIYPNPFNEKLNIEIIIGHSGPAEVEIISYDGKKVHSGDYKVENGRIILDLTELSHGAYLLKLSIPGNETVYKIEKR